MMNMENLRNDLYRGKRKHLDKIVSQWRFSTTYRVWIGLGLKLGIGGVRPAAD